MDNIKMRAKLIGDTTEVKVIINHPMEMRSSDVSSCVLEDQTSTHRMHGHTSLTVEIGLLSEVFAALQTSVRPFLVMNTSNVSLNID